jgi:hypothetical protein
MKPANNRLQPTARGVSRARAAAEAATLGRHADIMDVSGGFVRIASVLGVTMGLLVVVGGSASTTASAQDQPPPATATTPGIGHFGSLFTSPPPRNLVGGRLTRSRPTDLKASLLFKSPRLDQSEPRLGDKPSVVCGMTLLPADPAIDTGIRRSVPTDGEQFTMRRVVPEVCRQ